MSDQWDSPPLGTSLECTAKVTATEGELVAERTCMVIVRTEYCVSNGSHQTGLSRRSPVRTTGALDRHVIDLGPILWLLWHCQDCTSPAVLSSTQASVVRCRTCSLSAEFLMCGSRTDSERLQ